ncbi:MULTISPECIES: SCO family protein [unclassified Streptomyces]|uniref:SCO family protein n=1 Tax=Streptomyces johnsoniae TaxID=3075532 RepID=A0ABU2SA97_9ACTN|nr:MULTISPECIES: SCO family protein [unclassified Streptomyces]MDT0445896.1 SCO family protein [Streptomyces sp. DSM 41886]ONK12728.1 SCO1/SenC [Streptomyces sp. MP131-18]
MHLRTITTAAVAAATALALAACGSENDSGDDAEDTPAADVSGAHAADEGTVLDQPFDKPELVLTDTNGEPYDFAAETDGHATLLYFGYTNCPDICPLTMSNIAVAANSLTEEQRADLRVVFVTTDPDRDTPESLGPWINAHDPDFTGLTGDFADIQEAALALGVAIEPSYEDDNGDIVSNHGTQVVAFLPTDDKAHVVYTEGVTAETFERDLPGLIAGELP